MRIWLRRCGFSSMLSARVPIGAPFNKRVNKNRASAIVAKEQRGERAAKKERMKRQVQFRIQKTTGKEKKKTRNFKSSLLIHWSKKKLLSRFSASLDRKRQQKLFGTVQRMRNQILTLTCFERRAEKSRRGFGCGRHGRNQTGIENQNFCLFFFFFRNDLSAHVDKIIITKERCQIKGKLYCGFG